MNNQIKTYYIPTNPNITKGQIYTLYKNNINNLNLSSLPTSISITKEEYNKLIEIMNEYNKLIAERNTSIRNLVKEENNAIKKLTIINNKRQELTQKISKGDI